MKNTANRGRADYTNKGPGSDQYASSSGNETDSSMTALQVRPLERPQRPWKVGQRIRKQTEQMDEETPPDRDKRSNNTSKAEGGAQAWASKPEEVVKMDIKNPKTTMMVQVAESLMNGATNSTGQGPGLVNSGPSSPAPGS